MTTRFTHDMPFGAALLEDGRVRFRLWAPGVDRLDLILDGDVLAMAPQDGGWFALETDSASAGARYAYRLPDGLVVPDPASRAQAEDVHGPSLIVDPGAYAWRSAGWTGRPWRETVLYELHVGTATRQGGFAGVQRLLDRLAATGITALELMPVADFAGLRNWGYDGVLPFAPARAYGPPDELKALIDAAHARGLMVFLDVVYNHFGPEGNYLHAYAPAFFTDRYHTPWGAAIDVEHPVVRAFFVHNALYWIEEYRVDGLRFDAVHAIAGPGRESLLDDISAAVRGAVGAGRHVHLVLENDANEAHFLRGDPPPYDAQWNDDLHHALHVLLTGERDGYYEDYAERPAAALGRALAEGFVYQGEASRHRGGARRGEPSADLPPTRFVAFLQNHDQVGNRAFGDRMAGSVPPQAIRAGLALVLLAPSVPMLFMGEEIGAETPFPFFCDFEGALAESVREGRRGEFAHFAAFADPAARERIPDPNAEATFLSAKPGLDEPPSAEGEAWRGYVSSLLALRRDVIAPLEARAFRSAEWRVFPGGAVLVHWRFADKTLAVSVNLGPEPAEAPPHPLGSIFFASPDATGEVLPAWSVVWSVEDVEPNAV